MISTQHVDELRDKFLRSEGASGKLSEASWSTLPRGIKHLKVIKLWGRTFVHKAYNEKEAIRSRSFWLMQHEAGLCITPPIFSVSPSEAAKHGVSSGIFCQLIPGAKDVYTLMLENSVGHRDPRLDKIDDRDIRNIVIMDVLTGNYRHGGNILVRHNGRVRGIDHHFAFSHIYGGVGKICGTLIGQTLKLRWSFQLQDLLDITHLAEKLDYVRRGGCVGRKFPANSLKLMQKLSAMDAVAIMKRYGLSEAAVSALKFRLRLLLEEGLEAAITRLVRHRDNAHQELVRAGQWVPDEAQLLLGRIKDIFGIIPTVCREHYSFANNSLCSGVRNPHTTHRQPMYHCDTCNDHMCKACTYTCHKGHSVRFIGVSVAVCVCSTSSHASNHLSKNVSRFEPRVGTQCWFNSTAHPIPGTMINQKSSTTVHHPHPPSTVVHRPHAPSTTVHQPPSTMVHHPRPPSTMVHQPPSTMVHHPRPPSTTVQQPPRTLVQYSTMVHPRHCTTNWSCATDNIYGDAVNDGDNSSDMTHWVNGVVLRRHPDGSCDFYVTRCNRKLIIKNVSLDNIMSHKMYLEMEEKSNILSLDYFELP